MHECLFDLQLIAYAQDLYFHLDDRASRRVLKRLEQRRGLEDGQWTIGSSPSRGLVRARDVMCVCVMGSRASVVVQSEGAAQSSR